MIGFDIKIYCPSVLCQLGCNVWTVGMCGITVYLTLCVYMSALVKIVISKTYCGLSGNGKIKLCYSNDDYFPSTYVPSHLLSLKVSPHSRFLLNN